VFKERGISDLLTQVEQSVTLLEDLKVRAEFINRLRLFYETLNSLEHRPEVPGDVFRDAKLLGFINKVAASLYRDPALNLLGVAEKVKALIDAHVRSRGEPQNPSNLDYRCRVRKDPSGPDEQPSAGRPNAACRATTSSASRARIRLSPAR
jgi:hypothetical protein